jgi:hypothetical protein
MVLYQLVLISGATMQNRSVKRQTAVHLERQKQNLYDQKFNRIIEAGNRLYYQMLLVLEIEQSNTKENRAAEIRELIIRFNSLLAIRKDCAEFRSNPDQPKFQQELQAGTPASNVNQLMELSVLSERMQVMFQQAREFFAQRDQ